MRARNCVLAIASAMAAACSRGPVDWSEPTPLPPALAASQLDFDGTGHLVAHAAPGVARPVATECPGTMRVSGDTASGWFAVWWSVRSDSSADLMFSRSTNGITWSAAIRVDSTDMHASGCDRLPPAIYVDGANVHVAYVMHASEGLGIFVTHSMDSGMTFHTPATVAYGELPGHVAIAARGQIVVVAYEDPNATPRRIAVAVSRSGGHLYEQTVIASPPTGDARDPGVALGDGVLAVTWSSDSLAVPGSPRIVRMGKLR